jgi:hypothetical protein
VIRAAIAIYLLIEAADTKGGVYSMDMPVLEDVLSWAGAIAYNATSVSY